MTQLADRPTQHSRYARPLPRVDPISRLPIVVLNPHSRCNCRCAMCDVWRDTGGTEVSLDQVDRLVQEWRRLGVRQVGLSGGEALMHRSIQVICERISNAGIQISLMTTGLLLQRHAAWLPCYVAEVFVSLDGPEAVHDGIRRMPRAFGRLRAGVKAINDSGRGVRISGRCVVQKANFRHLRETVTAAREMGLESISFLAADVWSEAFNRPGGWSAARRAEISLDLAELAEMEGEIEALEREHAADFQTGFIVEDPGKLRARLSMYFRAIHRLADFPVVRCNAPWVSCVIEADGLVRPCFFQPAYGSLSKSESLEALLNSPSALEFRKKLDVGADPICRRCVCSLAVEE